MVGTKTEMERLLKDAEKLTGKKYNVSNFADITQAIHAIQVEMGIAGTTALEADKTISGSINSMKAAWENLITAMGNKDADLSEYINNFVDTVGTVGENLLPVIEQALNGVATLIDKLLPKIAEKIPEIITNIDELVKYSNKKIEIIKELHREKAIEVLKRN